jgi:hypothetical protein
MSSTIGTRQSASLHRDVVNLEISQSEFESSARSSFISVFGSRTRSLRRLRTAAAMTVPGMHTHRNSLQITSSPRALKNESPMGETLMGRNGKK